ncbi:AAA family ATPase [Frankia sp. Cpl3]|nr:AAA family ATPase [Frankia sp. Cpl3]
MPVEQVTATSVPADLWFRPRSAGRVIETGTALLYLDADRVLKRHRPAGPPAGPPGVPATAGAEAPAFHGRLARLAACRAEVRLNQPLAPGVYAGVADVVDSRGALCDHAVVMRRLPAGRQLSALVRAGAPLNEQLRHVARAIASFHERCAPAVITSATICPAIVSPGIAALPLPAAVGGPNVVGASAAVVGPGESGAERQWREALVAAQALRGTVLDADLVDEIGRLAQAYLAGRRGLLARRDRGGWIRDGHGALRADTVYCLDDGPRILGRPVRGRRAGDVLADIALLAVDLERLGAPEDADTLLRRYREYAGAAHPRSLEHLHLACRALQEAAATYAGDPREGEQARRLADIAYRHLRRARVRLVLVGGLPGTGKTTLAGRLAAGDEGRVLLRSDLVRAGLTSDGPDDATESYVWPLASETTARTYEQLLAQARRALDDGETVVIDASWSDGRHRAAAARLARDTSAELIELRCVTSPEVAAARLVRRDAAGRPGATQADQAGATAAVHRAMSSWAEPWPTARVIQTAVPEGEAFHAAERCVV